jgi:hypothetical protein
VSPFLGTPEFSQAVAQDASEPTLKSAFAGIVLGQRPAIVDPATVCSPVIGDGTVDDRCVPRVEDTTAEQLETLSD